MPGALLRSGKLQEFKPLGEDGQPVYTSAMQLREAIRLKLGRDAAHCLAVPQRNETGDRIDWYAPEEGDVVPWSAATDEERVEAKAMLEKMHASLLQVGSTMRTEQNRDRQIFGRLLEKVIYFPDDTHVYLVNGKPVLTFWGFTDPHGGSGEDPLGRLQPRAPAPVEAVAPPRAPDPVAVPPPVAVAPVKKRFPWWWLLLIPLLLLLIWFLLRSCAPEVEIPFITPPEVTEEQPLQPSETIRDGVRYDANGNVIGSSSSTSTQDSSGTTDQTTEPGTEPPPDLRGEETPPDAQQPEEQPPAEEPPVPEEQPPQDEQTPPAEEPKQEEPKPEEQAPPELQPEDQPKPEDQQQPTPPELQDQNKPQQPGQQPPQPGQQPGQKPAKPLEIPPDAAKTGNTDFLNGQWKAGSGIQDARTGKPMRLDYDMKDGKGKVKITGANGVECVGDVSSGMSGGSVVINNQGAAKCNDGSTYKLPNVTCKPGATSAADCSGQYENSNKFPMSMKQGG